MQSIPSAVGSKEDFLLASQSLCRLAEALRALLAARTPAGVERAWDRAETDVLGWDALAHARRRRAPGLEAALDEVDGLLLRLLDRLPALGRGPGDAAQRLVQFRLPQLERMQHATAAALVGQRYGAAGLRTVLADPMAPLGRRYYAYLALAERHPQNAWPAFERYLVPGGHHAFVGVAVEAARFYPDRDPAPRLTGLFGAVRDDLHLRAFLSPRILESLHVLADPRTLPFFRELLVSGHTDPDPGHCEVTYALVMVRRFTGRLAPSAKFRDGGGPEVAEALDEAEAVFEEARDVLRPVRVI